MAGIRLYLADVSAGLFNFKFWNEYNFSNSSVLSECFKWFVMIIVTNSLENFFVEDSLLLWLKTNKQIVWKGKEVVMVILSVFVLD